VTSVEAIARAALAARPGAGRPSIEVIGDPELGIHDARLEFDRPGHDVVVIAGSGDTSGWPPNRVASHCAQRIGAVGEELAGAAHVAVTGSLADLRRAWREAR
jgi:hypothetical protein